MVMYLYCIVVGVIKVQVIYGGKDTVRYVYLGTWQTIKKESCLYINTLLRVRTVPFRLGGGGLETVRNYFI